MSSAGNSIGAWQPLTPGGVAAFARAPWRRLLLVQFICASLVAGSAVWFFHSAWFPIIDQAIRQLPARGEIRSGTLKWTEPAPRLLADGHFAALMVDLDHTGDIRSPAHLQVEFGRKGILFISLLGYADYDYPSGRWRIAFNRIELEPWWGAWKVPILGISFAMVVLGLMTAWTLLATIGFSGVSLAGFFANRELTFRGSWKLAAAALLPGTLLLIAAIVLYGLGVLDLVQLGAAVILHLVAGAVYSLVSVFSAPKLESSGRKKNPFGG